MAGVVTELRNICYQKRKNAETTVAIKLLTVPGRLVTYHTPPLLGLKRSASVYTSRGMVVGPLFHHQHHSHHTTTPPPPPPGGGSRGGLNVQIAGVGFVWQLGDDAGRAAAASRDPHGHHSDQEVGERQLEGGRGTF